MKNYPEREVNNAKRQLNVYDQELKEVESKVADLEIKNQQYSHDLVSINKSCNYFKFPNSPRAIEFNSNKARNNIDKNESKVTMRDGGAGEIDSDRYNNPSSERQALLKKEKEETAQNQQSGFNFVVRVVNGQQINDVPIDLSSITKFSTLRDYLAKNYSIQRESLFLFDESGNILLDSMNLETALFPNVFRSLKNYVPTLTIELKKDKNKRNNQGLNSKEPLDTLVTLHDETQGPALKNQKKSSRFNNMDFIRALPKILIYIKHILENFAILALIAIFLVNRYASTDIVHKYKYKQVVCYALFKFLSFLILSINKATENAYQASISIYDNSDQSVRTTPIVNTLLLSIYSLYYGQADENSGYVFFSANMPSIMVQRRFKKNLDCYVPPQHKTNYNFDGTSNSCLDLSEETKETYGTQTDQRYQYQHLQGTDIEGYILRMPNDFNYLDVDDLKTIETKWLDFQTKSLTFYLNQYNTPSQMVTQTKIEVDNVMSDGTLQQFKFTTNTFSVKPETSRENILGTCVTVISSALLVFAFIEYFGVYKANTSNITVQLYQQRKANYDKLKLKEKHEQEEFEKNFGTAQPQSQSKKKKNAIKEDTQDHSYYIINLNWLFILIKRPLFFDIINIISLILILVQSGVLKTFRDKRKGLITQSDTYIHMDSYIDEENVINTLTAINTLLLMLSFTKYLASWSFTLKIYSQIMTTFVQKSWSIILVVLSIIFIVSFSWMTFIKGAIKNHDSFVYTILVSIKATFSSSFMQDLRILASSLPDIPPLMRQAVYSPFVIIVMLVIQVIVHYAIFAFISALMAHNIHVTKERMEQINKEIQDFEKRKVVNSTTFFRKSIQNFNNKDQQEGS